MSGVVFLYGYGRRKHVASGEQGRGGGAPARCGNWFKDEAWTLQDLRRWFGDAEAERRMAKLRALAVCKACAKGLDDPCMNNRHRQGALVEVLEDGGTAYRCAHCTVEFVMEASGEVVPVGEESP